MDIQIDSSSSVPLFHQIAEALRYQIAIGALAEGERIPSVRDAAQRWQVHFHTVRRAYQALADEGLLHMGPGKPTVVASRGLQPASEALRTFLAGFLQEGLERFGLSGQDLAKHIVAMDSIPKTSGPVHLVECSEGQSQAHALEIRNRWKVDAEPWSLDRPGEPPPGPIIATFFHFQEIRRRWPRRLGDINFVAIHPDQELPARIRTRLGRNPGRVLLWEREETMAANMASDLRTVFEPCGIPVEARVLAKDLSPMANLGENAVCLFAPRVWGHLPPEVRDHRHAFEATYRIRQVDLDELGAFLHGVRS